MTEFAAVFARLKDILSAHAPHLVIEHDTPESYSLNVPVLGPNKKPLFFGAVQIKKHYVSYHLFPVYMYPDLLESVPESLKRRMQGKSCFNFKAVDGALLNDLAALTQQGFDRVSHEWLDPK